MMRLGFALLVLVSHAPEVIDGDRRRELLTRAFHTVSFGELAVAGFFVISGFLITKSWDNTPSAFEFLRKRILRIYPGFVTASLVSLLLAGWFAGAPDFFGKLNPLAVARSVLFLQPPEIPPVYAGQPYPYANGALWTIAYEFRCYLLVLILGCLGILRRRIIVVVILVGSFSLICFPRISRLTFPNSWLLIGDVWQLTRFLCFFLSGSIYYLYRDYIRPKTGVALFFIPLLVACLFWKPATIPGLAILGSYVLLWLVFLPLPVLNKITPNIDISYGVYLYGWPTQKLLYWYLPNSSPWLVFVMSALISCILGALSFILVERPFLRMKSRKIDEYSGQRSAGSGELAS